MKRSTIIFASVVATVVMLTTTMNVNAQTSEVPGDSKALRLGIGFNAGLPLDDAYDLALGGDIRLQKDFTSNISATLSAGYTNFSFKDGLELPDGTTSISYIPVKAGVKVFPIEKFYVSAEAGAAFATEEGVGTSLVYAPGIGYAFNNGLDLGVRYEGFYRNEVNLGQVALRIAYGFNLSK
ncbi:MAG: outer membrane beta-barrel protein [Daejeonella sp.]